MASATHLVIADPPFSSLIAQISVAAAIQLCADLVFFMRLSGDRCSSITKCTCTCLHAMTCTSANICWQTVRCKLSSQRWARHQHATNILRKDSQLGHQKLHEGQRVHTDTRATVSSRVSQETGGLQHHFMRSSTSATENVARQVRQAIAIQRLQ